MKQIDGTREELSRITSNSHKLLDAVKKENKKCELAISKDLNEFKYSKTTFINNILSLSKKLLSSLKDRDYKYKSNFKYADIEINIENKKIEKKYGKK